MKILQIKQLNFRLFFCCLFFCIHFPIFYSFANEPQIKLSFPTKTLLLGDELIFEIKADGLGQNTQLRFPKIEGLYFKQKSTPQFLQHTTIINGKVTRFNGVIYTVGIQADKSGTFNIPQIEIEENGKKYYSTSFTIQVVKNQQNQEILRVELEPNKTEVFPTEELYVKMSIYSKFQLGKQSSFSNSFFSEKMNYTLKFPLLEQKDELNLQIYFPNKNDPTVNLIIDNYKVPFNQKQIEENGEIYFLYRTVFKLQQNKPGKLKIPAFGVRLQVPKQSNNNNIWGRRIQYQTFFQASTPQEIEILSLPVNNQPSSFYGGIGDFEIKSEIDNYDLKVGDPIELKVIISGKGNLKDIQSPSLSGIHSFVDQFQMNQTTQPGELKERDLIFRYIIRPKTTGIQYIPKIPFSFFDVNEKKYVTITTNQIPVTVRASKKVKETDVYIPNSLRQNATIQNEYKAIQLRANHSLSLSNRFLQLWIVLSFILSSIYIGLIIFQKRSFFVLKKSNLTQSPESVFKMHVTKAEKNQEDGMTFYSEIKKALEEYTALKLKINPNLFSLHQIQLKMKESNISQHIGEELIVLLQECEKKCYGREELKKEDQKMMLEKVNHWKENWLKNV